MLAVSKNKVRSMKDNIQTGLDKLINIPRITNFLGDPSGLVTIQYLYKGEKHELNECFTLFELFIRVCHKDYLNHFKLCERGEPLYNWQELCDTIAFDYPGIIYEFLKYVRRF